MIEVSSFPKDLEMKCVYENEASITAKYSGETSTTAQDGDVESSKLSFAKGFTFSSQNDLNELETSFTVGQLMNFKISYDVTAAGFSDDKVSNMPFGYFVETCHAQNVDDTDQKFYLIGTANDATKNTCPYTHPFFKINLAQSYAGDKTFWTSSDYSLEYDAFKIGGSSNLELVCDIQICLKHQCPTEAVDCQV